MKSHIMNINQITYSENCKKQKLDENTSTSNSEGSLEFNMYKEMTDMKSQTQSDKFIKQGWDNYILLGKMGNDSSANYLQNELADINEESISRCLVKKEEEELIYAENQFSEREESIFEEGKHVNLKSECDLCDFTLKDSYLNGVRIQKNIMDMNCCETADEELMDELNGKLNNEDPHINVTFSKGKRPINLKVGFDFNESINTFANYATKDIRADVIQKNEDESFNTLENCTIKDTSTDVAQKNNDQVMMESDMKEVSCLSTKQMKKDNIASGSSRKVIYQCTLGTYESGNNYHYFIKDLQSFDIKLGHYKCDMCKVAFKSNRDLEVHKSSKQDNAFKCDDCNSSFARKCDLNQHQSDLHNKYQYEFCDGQRKYSEFYFKLQEQYKCDSCNCSFPTTELLKSHTKQIHSKRILYQCEVCTYSSSTRSEFLKHTEQIHSKKRIYQCGVCTYSSLTRSEFLKHTKQIHSKKTIHQCRVCKYSALSRRKLLKHTKQIHSKKRKYQCGVCTYSSLSRSEFLKHTKSVHLNLRKCHDVSTCTSDRKKKKAEKKKKKNHGTKAICTDLVQKNDNQVMVASNGIEISCLTSEEEAEEYRTPSSFSSTPSCLETPIFRCALCTFASERCYEYLKHTRSCNAKVSELRVTRRSSKYQHSKRTRSSQVKVIELTDTPSSDKKDNGLSHNGSSFKKLDDSNLCKCNLCHVAFKSDRDLLTQCNFTKDNEYQCDHCDCSFATKSLLEKKKYVCDFCSYSTYQQSRLKFHIKFCKFRTLEKDDDDDCKCSLCKSLPD